MNDVQSKRRKLTLVNTGMARRKAEILELVKDQIAGDHTISIQFIRPGDGNTIRTTCSYPACPSPSAECLPGTYPVSLEPYCYTDAISKEISVRPRARFDLVQANKTGHLHGMARQEKVRWFCLRCFEHLWTCTEEEIGGSKALQTDDYHQLARLRRSMMSESRSGVTGVGLDLEVPHQMAFYRWCGFHSNIEHETGESPKDCRMVQGPEKEWMEYAEHQSLSRIRVPSAAVSAHINLNFVRGKSLSKIFEDLDISVMPAEQERRKITEEAERRQRAQARCEEQERATAAWNFA
ncbi:MAG: hypothetical protein Q9212_002308 [Teloschistes hypoglaucus]